MLKVAVLGATGRMGRAILTRVAEDEDLRLTGAVTHPGHPALGHDAGDLAGVVPFAVPVTDDRSQALHGAQVAIDFSLPVALEANVRACVEHGTALVIGTTGLSERHHEIMQQAAREIPLVYGRNMSVGVNVFMDLVARAARVLEQDYDAEIVEAHHRHKVDAPSGTALEIGERIAAARKHSLGDVAVYTRHGQTGPRVPGTIGFSVMRGGGVAGDHSVYFLAAEEQLEFVHRARDRAGFARGALRAARWVAGRAPGLYSMANVLGLSPED